MMLLQTCILLGAVLFISAQQNASLPLQLSPVSPVSTCSSTAAIRQASTAQVRSLLRDSAISSLQSRPPCRCGGPGDWTRIAHLDMSDPTHTCPTNWNLITTEVQRVRACGRRSRRASCDSAFFPSNGLSYSRVCGRINGYQQGTPSAFDLITVANPPGVDGLYIEGVSLTHGAAGSRQHIWTFAAALAESGPIGFFRQWACACSNVNLSPWPYTIPSYIGTNYFCDTGNRGPAIPVTAVYDADPLWDGAGCGPASTCCTLHNPPWFCTTLPQPTTDNLEVRICHNEDITNEDTLVSFIDIYVQ